MISTAAQYNVPCALELVKYFVTFYANAGHGGRFHFEPREIVETAEYCHGRPALRSQTSDMLSNLDLGLAEVMIGTIYYVDKKTGNTIEAKFPFVIHRDGKQEQTLSMEFESSGTKAAFILLKKILPALEHGGVVIIDEMEADLHPDMITAMLGNL